MRQQRRSRRPAGRGQVKEYKYHGSQQRRRGEIIHGPSLLRESSKIMIKCPVGSRPQRSSLYLVGTVPWAGIMMAEIEDEWQTGGGKADSSVVTLL